MAGNSQCVVNLFETNLAHIPASGPFDRKSLGPKHCQAFVFSSQCVGVNTIRKYMKDMFRKAEVDTTGRIIRNYSGKVSLCTSLYEKNFDKQATMSSSGHRSTAIRDYKRPSSALQMALSDAVQPPSPAKTAKREPESPMPSASVTEQTQHEAQTTNLTRNDSIDIHVPESKTTVIINKNGKRVSVIL